MKKLLFLVSLTFMLSLTLSCEKQSGCKRCYVVTENPQNVGNSSVTTYDRVCGSEVEYLENYEGHVGAGSYQYGYCEEIVE